MKKAFLLIFTLLLFSFSSCSKKQTPAPHAFPVNAAKVIKKDAPLYIDTIGHVEPIITVKIKSRVKGQITGVYFKEGDVVKKGDLLFSIDPLLFQANLDKNKAILLENLASLKIAEEKVRRYTVLTKEEYFSQLDFDQLKSDAERLSAVIKENQADIDSAEINLDYCWIYSPLNGRTGILKIDLGNWVKDDESQTLVTVNQMSPIYVTFSIPENELARLQKFRPKGEVKVRVSFDSLAKDYVEGDLEMLDNTVDEKTGMIALRATFANKTEELWPGQFVRTRLILTISKDALIIPYQAIDITTTGTFVFVVKEDKTVEMRSVKLGQREDEDVIVLEGLKEGETVVTEGLLNLYPGALVNIKKMNGNN